MVFNCGQCNGTGTYLGETCPLCGGDGEIDLLDPAMTGIDLGLQKRLIGLIANETLTKIADLTDKVNDVMDKCNDIMEKLNE